jgi:hypothetical protein
MSSIETQVSDFLVSIGCDYRSVYIGETKRKDWNDWPGDKWVCIFGAGNQNCGKRAEQSFDYFMGLGLRVDSVASKMARVTLKGCRTNSIAWQEQVIKQMTPKVPSAAGVLQSLILDSSAASETFNSWCDNFGYSNDSMKAHKLYLECQESADKLRQVFTPDQIKTLETLLQDY